MKYRTWTYTEPPSAFEISGCDCGNLNTQWSEFKDHLWCDKCNIDFTPKNWGVFDGPIPINCAKMLGLSFTRYHFKSKSLFVLDSDNSYIKVNSILNMFSGSGIGIRIKDLNKSFLGRVKFSNLGDLEFSFVNKISKSSLCFVEIAIKTKKDQLFSFTFNLQNNDGKLSHMRDVEYTKFEKLINVEYLDSLLKTNISAKQAIKI